MGEISAEYEGEIRRLIEATGLERTLRLQLSMMVTQMAAADPESEGTMQELVDRLDSSILVERLIPVYASNYTPEIVTAAADFYSTEIGRAFIAAQPSLMADTMPISNEWVMSAASQLMAEMMGGGADPTIH